MENSNEHLANFYKGDAVGFCLWAYFILITDENVTGLQCKDWK